MNFYTWYPISLAEQLPTDQVSNNPEGQPLLMVEEAYSNLLLYNPANGVMSGFYFPSERQVYRHREEWDEADKVYDWVTESFGEATHFMIIKLPEEE